jgi:hypothetical protein
MPFSNFYYPSRGDNLTVKSTQTIQPAAHHVERNNHREIQGEPAR